MSVTWMAIENSFPSFTGEESAREQIMKLQDYMFKLTNQLKYTLQNLDTTNWNTAALKAFSESTTEGVSEEAKQLANQLAQLNNTMNSLSSRVSELATRITNAESEIDYLQDRMDTAEGRLTAAEEDIAQNQQDIAGLEERTENLEGRMTDLDQAQADVEALEGDVADLLDTVQPSETGAVIGGEGKRIDLVGTIYINGVLYD